MIVVDTNIITYLYISGEHTEQVEQLLRYDPDWAVPVLWRSEFRNVLTLYMRKSILSLDQTIMIMNEAENMLREREYEISSSHIMRLSNSSDCSAYDCEFVALAQHLNCQLITADKKILGAFPEVAQSLSSFIH